jgi:hypothetical protein
VERLSLLPLQDDDEVKKVDPDNGDDKLDQLGSNASDGTEKDGSPE